MARGFGGNEIRGRLRDNDVPCFGNGETGPARRARADRAKREGRRARGRLAHGGRRNQGGRLDRRGARGGESRAREGRREERSQKTCIRRRGKRKRKRKRKIRGKQGVLPRKNAGHGVGRRACSVSGRRPASRG